MALITALLLALLLFAFQHFVKQNLLSPANLETAGKFQRMFQFSGFVLPAELIPASSASQPVKISPRKNSITGCPKRHESNCPLARAKFSPAG
ncbi:MAG TPA: hypothetical protein VLH08_03230 [Acidobacteriota bacterium]|nr:hypothetical protein [Acidobacteriota bacterium]